MEREECVWLSWEVSMEWEEGVWSKTEREGENRRKGVFK